MMCVIYGQKSIRNVHKYEVLMKHEENQKKKIHATNIA